jgi:hypothetical protein
MNLEQVALEEEECDPPVAKRVFQQADEQACDSDQLHRVALPTPTSLSHLDGLTLSNLLLMLSALSSSLLMQTGDRLLRSKMTSYTRRLSYTRLELPTHVTSRSTGIRVWLLPDMLNRSMPLLTTLNVFQTRPINLRCSLAHLPPSITRFCLSNVHIAVYKAQDMVFNLPALVDLFLSEIVVRKIDRVKISQHITSISNPSNLVPDDDWLVGALQSSRALVTVLYNTITSANSDANSAHSHAAVASLPLVEDLEVKRFPISRAHWPPHLHTLRITGTSMEDVKSIPDTVTNLSVSHSISDDTLFTWLSMAPSSLLALRVNGRNITFGDGLWLLIARFTKLHSLQIPHAWKYEDLPSSLGDLSLLPTTIKVLSSSFAFVPAQWSQLPVGVTFAYGGNDIIVTRTEMPYYWEKNHAAHVDHFPKKVASNLFTRLLFACWCQ